MTTRLPGIGSGYRPAAWCRCCHVPHCVTLPACPECGHPVAHEPVALPDTAEHLAYVAYTLASGKRHAAFAVWRCLPLGLRESAFETYAARADEANVLFNAWITLVRARTGRSAEGGTP